MHVWLKKIQRQGQEPKQAQGMDVIAELREVRRQLDGIQSYFALESDEDLIDAAIYLRDSLEARQRYLLKLAREHNTVATALPIQQESRERQIN